MMMAMKPRPKLRNFCRWMLTILTVVFLVVWIGSGWYSLESNWSTSLSSDELIAIDYGIEPFIVLSEGTLLIVSPLHNLDITTLGKNGWSLSPQSQFKILLWVWRWDEGGFSLFPLWIPALLVAIPTSLMWGTHIIARRRKPGMCTKCGYDIAGLLGKEACPECGTKFKTDGAQASAS